MTEPEKEKLILKMAEKLERLETQVETLEVLAQNHFRKPSQPGKVKDKVMKGFEQMVLKRMHS